MFMTENDELSLEEISANSGENVSRFKDVLKNDVSVLEQTQFYIDGIGPILVWRKWPIVTLDGIGTTQTERNKKRELVKIKSGDGKRLQAFIRENSPVTLAQVEAAFPQLQFYDLEFDPVVERQISTVNVDIVYDKAEKDEAILDEVKAGSDLSLQAVQLLGVTVKDSTYLIVCTKKLHAMFSSASTNEDQNKITLGLLGAGGTVRRTVAHEMGHIAFADYLRQYANLDITGDEPEANLNKQFYTFIHEGVAEFAAVIALAKSPKESLLSIENINLLEIMVMLDEYYTPAYSSIPNKGETSDTLFSKTRTVAAAIMQFCMEAGVKPLDIISAVKIREARFIDEINTAYDLKEPFEALPVSDPAEIAYLLQQKLKIQGTLISYNTLANEISEKMRGIYPITRIIGEALNMTVERLYKKFSEWTGITTEDTQSQNEILGQSLKRKLLKTLRGRNAV